jgi:hypothetical protein
MVNLRDGPISAIDYPCGQLMIDLCSDSFQAKAERSSIKRWLNYDVNLQAIYVTRIYQYGCARSFSNEDK